MEVEENPLDKVGEQWTFKRIFALNDIGLTAARIAARSHATQSRMQIPALQRAAFVDLSDEDLRSFAETPFCLFKLQGLSEQHELNPARDPMGIDCEVIRRIISLAKDTSSVSITAARALLGLTPEDFHRIKNLTDDDIQALSTSSRLDIVPRIAPEDKYRTPDGMRWDGQARLRAFVLECDKLLPAMETA